VNYLDRAFQGLSQWLEKYLPDSSKAIAVPVFALVAVVVARLLIKQVLPVVLRVVVVPAVIATIAIAGMALLAIQLCLAAVCRLFRLRPPSILYAVGDLTVAALSRTASLGAFVPHSRIQSVRLWLPIALVTVLLWRWDADYCERLAEVCTSPLDELRLTWKGFVS
jgi:hypothetical protein